MHFTAENEALLRDALASEDTAGKIREVSARIEEMEKKMASQFNTTYIDVITKCAVLGELQESAHRMRKMSSALRANAEDVRLRQEAIEEEHDGVLQALERLERVQEEVARVDAFVAEALEAQKSKDIYQLVRGLERMERLKIHFKKYNYYKVIKRCYEDARDRTHILMEERTAAWMEGTDLKALGRAARTWERAGVWDCVLKTRAETLHTDILVVAYAARRRGSGRLIAALVDNWVEMKILELTKKADALNKVNNSDTDNDTDTGTTIIDKDKASKNLLNLAIGLVLFCHFTSAIFPSHLVFYGRIVAAIENTDQNDLIGAIALREALEMLQIDVPAVDAVVEKAAFRHFEKRVGTDNFSKRIREFADESAQFLSRNSQNSNELDDLYAQRIDALLTAHLSNAVPSSSDSSRDPFIAANDFAACQAEATELIAYVVKTRPALRDFSFSVHEYIARRNAAYIEAAYSTVARRIRGAKNSQDVVQAILSAKGFTSHSCQQKLIAQIREHSSELFAGHSKDELCLFNDTIKRNFTAKADSS